MSCNQTEIVKVQRSVPDYLSDGYDRVSTLSKPECLQLWSALTGKAVDILRQRAQLIYRFEQEGWDVHQLGNGHAYYYLRIAYGQMLPELFVAVADPSLLDRVSRLAIPDQERVVRNETVKVLIGLKDSGEPYFQDIQLTQLAPRHATVLLRGNKINGEAEQIAYVRSRTCGATSPRIGTLTP